MPISFTGNYSQNVVAATDLSLESEARPEISWQPLWRELDLVFGLAVDGGGAQTLLNPANFATLPRAGVQLADVTVLGSDGGDRIFAGVGSLIDGAGGSDELFNIDSQGNNLLIGGDGADRLFLRAVNDRVIGGQLFRDATAFGLSPFTALVDRERDSFLIDAADPGNDGSLQILDYEPGIDALLINGTTPEGNWAAVRQQLQQMNIAINAAPQLSATPVVIGLNPGDNHTQDLSSFGFDLDTDKLELLKFSGPDWISTSGTTVKASVPTTLTADQLASIALLMGFSDGKAISTFTAKLILNAAPTKLELTNAISSLAENTNTTSRIKLADLAITDDALGTNTISLSGPDSASFEVVGSTLFLKAGTSLNFEAKTSYTTTISVSDPALTDSTPASAAFSLAITDINEAPTTSGIPNIAAVENEAARTVQLSSAFSDPDTYDKQLTFGIAQNSNPGLINASIAPGTDALLIDFTKNKSGSGTIEVRATDSGSNSISARFTVFVAPADANKDGIPDKDQANVIPISTPNQSFATFVSEASGPIPSVNAISNPDPTTAPTGVDFNQGFYSVDYNGLKPGASTILTLYLPEGSTANSYWKYGPVNTGGSNQWYDFSFDPATNTGAKFRDINGDGQNEILLHFTDGLRGDNDLTVNGSIADPGAPAFDPRRNQEPSPGIRLRATRKRDVLTGTPEDDTFIFPAFQSTSTKRKPRYDRVTNFEQGDRILIPRFKENVMGTSDDSMIPNSRGSAKRLGYNAINKALGEGFRGKSIAAFNVERFDGTFVAINAKRPGFDRHDMLIFLDGYNIGTDGPILLA